MVPAAARQAGQRAARGRLRTRPLRRGRFDRHERTGIGCCGLRLLSGWWAGPLRAIGPGCICRCGLGCGRRHRGGQRPRWRGGTGRRDGRRLQRAQQHGRREDQEEYRRRHQPYGGPHGPPAADRFGGRRLAATGNADATRAQLLLLCRGRRMTRVVTASEASDASSTRTATTVVLSCPATAFLHDGGDQAIGHLGGRGLAEIVDDVGDLVAFQRADAVAGKQDPIARAQLERLACADRRGRSWSP